MKIGGARGEHRTLFPHANWLLLAAAIYMNPQYIPANMEWLGAMRRSLSNFNRTPTPHLFCWIHAPLSASTLSAPNSKQRLT